MKQETVKKLQEHGYPQRGNQEPYTPSLEELIEDCKDEIMSIERTPTPSKDFKWHWEIRGLNPEIYVECESLTEGMANFWLQYRSE